MSLGVELLFCRLLEEPFVIGCGESLVRLLEDSRAGFGRVLGGWRLILEVEVGSDPPFPAARDGSRDACLLIGIVFITEAGLVLLGDLSGRAL